MRCVDMLCTEYTAMMVPLSCCAKDQYGNYFDTSKCQNWDLGPPNKQTSTNKDINEALHYTVCIILTDSDDNGGITISCVGLTLCASQCTLLFLIHLKINGTFIRQ